MAGDQDMIGMCLRYASSDCAHANFGYEFHADTSTWIGVFQVVDQLCEIFDGIDIVMRRRANESDTWSRVTNPRNGVINLATR